MIDVSMITVPRSGMYVHRTISNLEASGFFRDHGGPLRIHVGSSVVDHVRRYASDRRFKVERVGLGDERVMSQKKIWQRQGLNYVRCLQGAPDGSMALALEDDLDFSVGWYGWMKGAASEISRQFKRWILTLICFSDEPSRRHAAGHKWLPDGAERWCGGACAILYSAGLAREFASYVHLYLVVKDEWPTDLLLHRWARETGVQFCATAPSIVQHIGEVSTGLGGGGRKSPSFVKELS